MLVVCAWCGKRISGNSEPDGMLSHGICNDCAASHFRHYPVEQVNVLDQFHTPILIVGADGNIETANQAALDLLHKDRGEIKYQPGGNVFNCVYSALPEGCGKTIHCKSCTVRRTVEQVLKTGKPLFKIPATLKVMQQVDENDIACTISAEKVGEMVVLTIENIIKAETSGTAV